MKRRLVVLGIGVLGSFLLGEIALRLFRHELFSHSNLILRDLKKSPTNRSSRQDPELGWILPWGGKKIDRNLVHHPWGVKDYRLSFTSTERGFRSTPNVWNDLLDETKPILTLGDSFTFGVEVNDEETWPTHLQALVKKKVMNGGVSLYGLDQSFIRLQRYLEKHQPHTVILSVIRENIARTSQKKRRASITGVWVDRPYFVKNGQSLELINTPVPQQEMQPSLGPIRTLLGRSHLFDLIFSQLAFNYWYGIHWGEKLPEAYLTGEDPSEISCLILKEIAALSKKHSFKPVVLGQYYWQNPLGKFKTEPLTQRVLQCARELNLVTLDLEPELKALAESSPDEYNTLYFPGAHMTNRGNAWVAQKLAQVLK